MGLFDFLKRSNAPDSAPAPQQKKPRTDRPQYPVQLSQRQVCERLSLTIEPWMFQFDVADMIEEALTDPAKRAIEDEHWRKFHEDEEREWREEYGDAIVDEYKKWQPYAFAEGYFLVVIKRGKSRVADVAQIGEVDFPDNGKVWVSIGMTLPKVFDYGDAPGFVNWEKDITVKSPQILHIEPVDPGIQDIDQPATYRALKVKVEAIAASLPS